MPRQSAASGTKATSAKEQSDVFCFFLRCEARTNFFLAATSRAGNEYEPSCNSPNTENQLPFSLGENRFNTD
eukprot:evm.model.NODE_14360_length_15469_cov_66.113579.1